MTSCGFARVYTYTKPRAARKPASVSGRVVPGKHVPGTYSSVGCSNDGVRFVTRRRNAQAPCIIFIDEVDAIGTKRFDSDLSGDREVQRTMLELLNQLDGFSSDDRIKVRHSHVTRINRRVSLGACAHRSGMLTIIFPMMAREIRPIRAKRFSRG
jgi:SpoVK/Ycf46/Vps4 family AAA+-type ATPase